MVFDLKNTQAMVTMQKVKMIAITSVAFGKIDSSVNKSLLVLYFFVFPEIKLGAKNVTSVNDIVH